MAATTTKRKTPKKTKATADGGTIYIGRRIAREFNGELYQGTVDSYRSNGPRHHHLWHVKYDDDDEEELNRSELLLALDKFARNNNFVKDDDDKSAPPPPPYVGRRISKKFGKEIYHGTVDGFDESNMLWKIAYDDGDAEEMGLKEVLFAMDLYDCSPAAVKEQKQQKLEDVVEASEPSSNQDTTAEEDKTTTTSDDEKKSVDDDKSTKPIIKNNPFTIPIIVAVTAIVIWLCQQQILGLFAANAAKQEDFLRSTSLLKFQPDKFQGAYKKKRYFEGWYYKFVSNNTNTTTQTTTAGGKDGGSVIIMSMAVVPGIFYGPTFDSNESHAFIFVTLNGERQHYYRFNTNEFSYASNSGKEEYYIQVGNNRFTHAGVSLNLQPQENDDDADLVLKGYLSFTNPSPWPVSLMQLGAMGPVGYIPGLECTHGILSFDHILHGSLSMSSSATRDSSDDGEQQQVVSSSTILSFDGGRGYTEKDFGRSFPSLWVWIQSNSFRNNPGTSLFVSVARVPVFGMEFPGFTAAIWHDGTLIPFATWSGAKFEDIYISKEKVYIAMRSTRSSRKHRRRRLNNNNNNDYYYRVEITVDRRNVPEVLLYAPVNFTKMAPFVREALQAKAHLRLFNGNGDLLLDDVGEYTGLEVHGNVQWLVDNVCGKETANKIICL